MFKVERDSDKQIREIWIDDEKLLTDNDEVWSLPKRFIAKTKVSELPRDASFDLCNIAVRDSILLDTIPIRLKRTSGNQVHVHFEDSGQRKWWDGQIDLKTLMETKRAVVEDRVAEIGDISFVDYSDDGEWIHLSYAADLTAAKVLTVVELAEQIVAEIEGAAEMRLGCTLWAPAEPGNEKAFTLQMVLPILRKLRFQNVRYNHGKREFGKDIVFARFTEFHEVEHWGAQVKFGDISGGAASEVDGLLGQIDDAFKMPFYDLYTKQKQWISKLAIIVSGRFTNNAVEKICEKIESSAVRKNVVFMDGEKISTLAEQFAAPEVRSRDRNLSGDSKSETIDP